MLKSDEAHKRLNDVRIVNCADKRIAALAKLPKKVNLVGRSFFDRDEQGKAVGDWSKRQELHRQGTEALFELSDRDRRKLFAALFPTLAPFVEAAYNLLARLPYQTGYSRKAFRAPSNPEAFKDARWGWLNLLSSSLGGYEQDVEWVASFAPYIPHTDRLGLLLAAAIEAGGETGDKVFDILKQSATNEHPIGMMGRHVSRALLVASRPEGWEFMEKMLLAAQRQEGLRQVILETIDEAHPEAFRRMLRLILENDLLRFSATVRAADVWFGLQWDSATPSVIRKTIEKTLVYLEQPDTRQEAFAKETAEEFYLALWAQAMEDVGPTIPLTAACRNDESLDRRFLAVYWLSLVNLPASKAELPKFIDDADLRIAMRAFNNSARELDLFEQSIALLRRLPEKDRTGAALVWPWTGMTISPTNAADRLAADLGSRSPKMLIPFLPRMSSRGKRTTIEKLAKQKKWDHETRNTLFSLINDRDSYTRRGVFEALKEVTIDEAEAQRLEPFLTRKTGDVRQGVLKLLASQKQAQILESADRLLEAKKAEMRLGGLELCRVLVEQKKAEKECRARASAYLEKFPKRSDQETLQIEIILDSGRVVPTLEDGLGTVDLSRISPRVQPKETKAVFLTQATLNVLKALDALIVKHETTPIQIKTHQGTQETLLGNVRAWSFPKPDYKEPLEKNLESLPLREVWQEWLTSRPKNTRDRDGCELLRAGYWYEISEQEWTDKVEKQRATWGYYLNYIADDLTPVTLKHEALVGVLLQWFLRMEPPTKGAEFLLDTSETALSLVPQSEWSYKLPEKADWSARQKDWRHSSPPDGWRFFAHSRIAILEALGVWKEQHTCRWWPLMHWRDQPAPGVTRYRPTLDLIRVAWHAGKATTDDIFEQLLGPQDNFSELKQLTACPLPEALKTDPQLAEVVERCRQRILEIELARGENSTAATKPAQALNSVYGLDLLMRLLGLMKGRKYLDRYHGSTRADVFTHLISVCYPLPQDSPEEFSARMKKDKVTLDQLLPLAFLAPQWLRHLAHHIGWPGFREAVWWIGFHTHRGARITLGSDDGLSPDFKPQEAYEKMWLERSQITRSQFGEGIIDVGWFKRTYETIKPARWKLLMEAGRGIVDRSGLKKAQYAAEVILGKVPKKELVNRIKTKYSREAVRLLGLLPLPSGERREKDLQGRYKVYMFYRRYARSLSPMGREGAQRDLEIGLSNLAQTAGYPDPVRMGWAMEAREMADLAQGPISAAHQGVTVTLRIDEHVQPELTVKRGEKTLKSIPTPVRKHKKVADLAERRMELKRQVSRVKQSLEGAMLRGDVFSGAELKHLFTHPLLKPLLERLVLAGEGIVGFPTHQGQALTNHAGKIEPVKASEALRIAHCHDLFTGAEWHHWQAHLFQREVVQPFKQVFRELYVPTAQEKKDEKISRRYTGQQINPKQAQALWGSRLWNTRDEISKTFHDLGIVARVSFQHHGWTAAEVEGWTLDTVQFHKRGEYGLLPLVEVPPLVFSEVMRDCDLVVSVAHRGGVDPEASASTVEMRTSLVRETCSLLGLKNVGFKSQHILIDGHLAKYSIHLGSGVVHRQPGGHLCIVPVHAQHRGRLFLPFADDDPRTAEVVSKVLLLARDKEIQDPSILEQLR